MNDLKLDSMQIGKEIMKINGQTFHADPFFAFSFAG